MSSKTCWLVLSKKMKNVREQLHEFNDESELNYHEVKNENRSWKEVPCGRKEFLSEKEKKFDKFSEFDSHYENCAYFDKSCLDPDNSNNSWQLIMKKMRYPKEMRWFSPFAIMKGDIKIEER